MTSSRRAPVWVLAAGMVASCARDAATTVVEADVAAPEQGRVPRAELVVLRALEEAQRLAIDFSRRKRWDARSGADPFAVLRLDDGRWIGIERGRDALVVLDARASVIQREASLSRPTGLARDEAGDVWVVGEGSASVARYRVDGSVSAAGSVEVDGAFALRDIAVAGDWLYVADRHRGRIRALRIEDEPALRVVETHDVLDCPGASAVRVTGQHLVCNCMLAHTVVLLGLEPDGRPILRSRADVKHDGPIWAIEAVAADDGINLAVGGVEDHPLDRTDGAFGFIDSFVFTYRLRGIGSGEPSLERRAEINVAEHGVITPKALQLRSRADGWSLAVSGYGGDRMVELELDDALRWTAGIRSRALPAGIVAFDGGVDAGLAADPLLDAWVVWDDAGESVVPAPHPDDDRTLEERMGEALAFTRLMAPWNESTGRRSRFTCETCHFEGTVDGRTHWTGRGEVHATTKTLQGLFENRPHFTRALDLTTSGMVHSEFRVANRASERGPWFRVPIEEVPWVRWLGAEADDLDPLQLRRALLAFLLAHGPASNPAAVGRASFDATERQGAALFSEHCERCHQARLVTDRPESRVPRGEWEAHVFGAGAIVWAEDERRQTGIEPYVHADGARTPSLRRLWVKHPYFTNGSARDLASVLEGVLVGEPFAHAGEPGEGQRRLALEERVALAAFLDLL